MAANYSGILLAYRGAGGWGGGQLAQSETRGALPPGFQTAMLYKPGSGLTLWLVLALHGSLHHELIGIGKKTGFCALRIAEYGSLAL